MFYEDVGKEKDSCCIRYFKFGYGTTTKFQGIWLIPRHTTSRSGRNKMQRIVWNVVKRTRGWGIFWWKKAWYASNAVMKNSEMDEKRRRRSLGIGCWLVAFGCWRLWWCFTSHYHVTVVSWKRIRIIHVHVRYQIATPFYGNVEP